MFDGIDAELKARLDILIKGLEDRIEASISNDDTLAETAIVRLCIPVIGPVASTMLIAEMPEISAISGAQAAALAGLAPIALDSETLRGSGTLRAAAVNCDTSCSKLHWSPRITTQA